MTAQPAFTPVVARRTLVKAPALSAKIAEFPPSVVDYVQRAFFEFNRHKDSPAFVGITDTDLRRKLSETVNEAAAQGATETRNWSLHPLPHQLILDERQHAAVSVQQADILASINAGSEALSIVDESGSPVLGSRKRKSLDEEVADSIGQNVTPPWKKKKNGKATLEERMTGKSKSQDKKQRKENSNGQGGRFDTSSDALERRRQRFGHVSPEPSSFRSRRDEVSAIDSTTGPIVGTCEILEKNYFRLTAPPNPSTVRPLSVLEKALAHVLMRWKEQHDYTYVCDQLKSLRQDLTVQRIRTRFTIKVYEAHATIALQMKDLGEYNQCQTQLRALYKLRLGKNGSSGGRQDEFTAYRILYLIYTRSRADMNNMLADLTTADKEGPYVRLALQVRAALASGNYHKFFRLYDASQDWGMVPYLMDMFIERERLAAMTVMCKAYKPDVGSRFVVKELGFGHVAHRVSEEDCGRACLDFIVKWNGASLLQQKEADDVRVLTGKAGNTFEDAKRAAFGSVDIKGQI